MDRKGVSFQQIFLSLIVFCFFIMGIWSVVFDFTSAYDVSVNESWSMPFNETLQSTNALGTQVADSIANPEASVTDQLITFVSSGISSLQIFFSGIPLVTGMTFIVADIIGIPDFIVTTFLAVFTLVIVFALVAALLKTAP